MELFVLKTFLYLGAGKAFLSSGYMAINFHKSFFKSSIALHVQDSLSKPLKIKLSIVDANLAFAKKNMEICLGRIEENISYLHRLQNNYANYPFLESSYTIYYNDGVYFNLSYQNFKLSFLTSFLNFNNTSFDERIIISFNNKNADFSPGLILRYNEDIGDKTMRSINRLSPFTSISTFDSLNRVNLSWFYTSLYKPYKDFSIPEKYNMNLIKLSLERQIVTFIKINLFSNYYSSNTYPLRNNNLATDSIINRVIITGGSGISFILPYVKLSLQVDNNFENITVKDSIISKKSYIDFYIDTKFYFKL